MTAQQPWRFHVLDVVRVVDGDTYDLLVDVGFRLHAIQRFRLRGVDTPEIYGVGRESEEYKRGLAAQDAAADWLDHNHDVLTVVSHGEQSFGRWVADIIGALGHSLAAHLVDEGHAQEVNE